MPKNPVQRDHAGEGVKGVLEVSGSDRHAVVERLVELVGAPVAAFCKPQGLRLALSVCLGILLAGLVLATVAQEARAMDATVAHISTDTPRVSSSEATTSAWFNAGLYGGRADHYLAVPVSGTLFANVGLSRGGLYKSSDHGDTWSELMADNPLLVGVDSVHGKVVAAQQRGLALIGSGTVQTTTLGFETADPRAVGGGAIYFGTHYPHQDAPLTLRRSTDEGASWVTATLPYPLYFTDTARSMLVVGPGVTTSTVYLSNPGGTPAEGVWRGVWNGNDFGWTKIFTHTDISHIRANPHYTQTRQIWATIGSGDPWRIEDDPTGLVTVTEMTAFPGSHSSVIAFHPVSPTTVYVDDQVTPDNGNSWSWWNNPFTWGAFPIVFDPTDPTHNTIWMGSNAGMWRTIDHGSTWTQRASGIEAVDVYDVAQNPVDVRVIYAATDGGLWRTMDFDTISPTWELVDPDGVDIPVYNTLLNDPSDTRLIRVMKEAGGLHEAEYGETSTLSELPGLGNFLQTQLPGVEVFMPDLAADPVVSGTIFGAGYGFSGGSLDLVGGVFASGDAGVNWTRPLTYPAFALLVADGRLFAGIYGGAPYGPGYGLVSTTLPLAGSPIWSPVASSIITTTVIAMDHYSNTLLVGAGINEGIRGAAGTRWQRSDLNQDGRVYVSDDNGATWTDVTPVHSDPNYPAGPFRAVSIDSHDTGHLRVASRAAVYESYNGGATWSELTGELWQGVYDIGYMAACPAPVTELTGTVSGSGITLTWTSPADYVGAMVRVDPITYPTLSTMGSIVTSTVLTNATYSGLGSGPTYFGVFAYDEEGHVGRSTQLMVEGGVITVTARGRLAGPPPDHAWSSTDTAASRSMSVLANSGGIYRTRAASPGPVYRVYLPVVRK